MKTLIIIILLITGSALNIFSNQIVDYDIKQVANFQISEGAKDVNDIIFKDSLNGIALVRNQDYEFYIFRTTNAGDSWDFISEIDIYDRWVMKGIAPPSVTGMVCYDDFICITTQPYLALFGPQPPADTGVYMISYDFGKTWEINNFPEKLILSSPQFDELGNLYLLASNWDFRKRTSTRKGIFKFTISNNTWQEIKIPELPDSSLISNLRIYSNNEYHFNTVHYQIDPQNNLFSTTFNIQTTNSGLSWELFEFPFKNISVKFTSKDVIWIPILNVTIVNDSTVNQEILLLKSNNRGETWSNIHIENYTTKDDPSRRIRFSSFNFYDDDNLWLRYQHIPDNRQFITNNGGKDWFKFPEFDPNIVKSTPNFGYYLNKNTLFLLNTFLGHLLYKFTFDIATSVREETEELLYKIFPNPATDYVYINFADVGDLDGDHSHSNKIGLGDVRIYTTFGECVTHLTHINLAQTYAEGQWLRLDVSHLSAGVYFVRIGNKVEKFVKW